MADRLTMLVKANIKNNMARTKAEHITYLSQKLSELAIMNLDELNIKQLDYDLNMLSSLLSDAADDLTEHLLESEKIILDLTKSEA